MIDLIKRYYWGLNLLVIGVSAYFAARASLHVVEAKFLLGEDALLHHEPAPSPHALPELDPH